MEIIQTSFGDFVWDKHYSQYHCEHLNHPLLKQLAFEVTLEAFDSEETFFSEHKEKVKDTVEDLLNKFVNHEKDGKTYIREIVEDDLFSTSFAWSPDSDHELEGKLTSEQLIELLQRN